MNNRALTKKYIAYLFTDGIPDDGELTFDFYYKGEHLETKSLHKLHDIYYEAEILARDYE